MLKDRVIALTRPEEVEAFLTENPNSVIFKAGTCHKTMQGFGFLQERLEPREDLRVGLIRVVEARPASDLVAEKTGLRHESPQVILFRDGDPVFEANNWDITPETLAQGFERLPEGEAAEPSAAGAAVGDLQPYLDLLEGYLAGALNDQEFEFRYTHLFRDDASLRSNREVAVLNSIFGDVDQHMNMHMMMAGQGRDEKLREKADAAYRDLKELTAQPA